MRLTGCITLDIDGTVTDNAHSIPSKTLKFLKDLADKDWHIVFITGRTFSFAIKTLHDVNFPYTLALQNGADILKMPQREVLHRAYITPTLLPRLDALYHDLKEDYVIYAGYDRGDFCFYRPGRYSPEMLSHLLQLQNLSPEPWVPVSEYSQKEIGKIPLIKCFGTEKNMRAIKQSLLDEKLPVATSVIRDPLSAWEGLYINLVTHPSANKGSAMEWVVEHYKIDGPLIAAGDDENDIPMLSKADIAIVMETAPDHVKKHGKIIAPSARSEGIVQGITQALRE